MKKLQIDILGHDNYALSLIIDFLKDIHGELPKITIVKNLPDHKNPYKDVIYSQLDDDIKTMSQNEWKGNEKETLIIGAANSKTKKVIYKSFKKTFNLNSSQFINLIHPMSYQAPSVILGNGLVCEPMSTIASFAELNDFVWLKRNASVGHHTKIGKFVNINPGAIIASSCSIGDNCLIGAGAIIKDGISIESDCIVGAGAVVIKNLPKGMVVVGNPARIIKKVITPKS